MLTPREKDVALMAARGLSTKQIARELEISPHTVRSHMYRMFARLGIDRRGEILEALCAERMVTYDEVFCDPAQPQVQG